MNMSASTNVDDGNSTDVTNNNIIMKKNITSEETTLSIKEQINIQLDVIESNFQFYHAWQPSSFESLDDQYYDNDTIIAKDNHETNILVVKSLPEDVDKDNLRDFFSLFGQVLSATVSDGIGTITFEDGGSAEKAMSTQPMKIFGQTVEIQLGMQQEDDVARRGGRRLSRQRTVPFPVVIAPPNFGPLQQDVSTRFSSKMKVYTHTQTNQVEKSSSNESKGILNKATQTLASATTKFLTPNEPQHNGLVSSAPPALSPPKVKSSLHSLLSSPIEDPLFDDDEEAMGESTHRKHIGLRDELLRTEKKMKNFHSDNALISWVWSPELSSKSQSELDLGCALLRGRAVNAKLPLLASTISSLVKEDGDEQTTGLDNTNLHLLHKVIDMTARKKDGAANESNDSPQSKDVNYKLYQARHPGLATLISVTRCTDSKSAHDLNSNGHMNNHESFTSVFDITPTHHRSLHELLRTEDFLTQPLFPGVEGHEFEPLNDSAGATVKGKGMPWLRSARTQNNSLCSCRNRDGWRDEQQRHGGMVHSSSEPNLLPEHSDEEDEEEDLSFADHFLNDLRKLGDATRAISDKPPPNFIRRRRPWKLFKVGSSYRASVADLRIRFLALQLFNVVNYCHDRGVTLGEQLSPDRIFVQEDGWIRLVIPITQLKPESDVPRKSENIPIQNNADVQGYDEMSPRRRRWRSIFRKDGSLQDKSSTDEGIQAILPYPGFGDVPTVQWQRGQLTNLCYLMMLNAAAGRTVGNHANPPILPWTTNFSREIDLFNDRDKVGASDESPWRDLSKSKFRLKKGDEQLDKTFHSASPPHHVPETICELTYSIYRARCLPITQLKKIVREDFIAEHYPGSIQALYEWSPDEATLDFYTMGQPDIFRSIHRDMKDLALPSWCDNPNEFIEYHRRLLESDHVSRQLHEWIDIQFGHALAGKRAIAEKNVVISAVPFANGGCQDQCQGNCHSIFSGSPADVDEKHLMSSSLRKHHSQFIQLFAFPHPKKHSDLRKNMSLALRTAFNQNGADKKVEDAEDGALAGSSGTITDFQSRKQRDLSTIGALLTDCYTAARVIPTPNVEEAINHLTRGTLDLHKCLKGKAEHSMTFPFPQHVKDAYQILSKVQSLTFTRSRKEEDIMDNSEPTSCSTDLELTWRLIQNAQCLDSLSSTSLGLILPTLLYPLESIEAFIENCIGGFTKSSFTERFQAYLLSLTARLISADLITSLLFEFVKKATEYASNNPHLRQVIANELSKLILSSSLIHSLYNSSCGETFISRVSAFATEQLCFQSTTAEPFIPLPSLLAQNKTLGPSICCKYVVPSLVNNIQRSVSTKQGNIIAQALKNLLPLIPGDTIGILICKPILRCTIPAQLHGDKSSTSQVSDSESLNLLRDLTVLLQCCLSYIDSTSILKYYFHSNSNSILQLLSGSFEAIPIPTAELDDESFRGDTSIYKCGDLLKETSVLVRDIIRRIDTSHFQEVLMVVDKFCSQMNDAYLSMALNRASYVDANEILVLPGISAAHMISSEANFVCGGDIFEMLCPAAVEFQSWFNQACGIKSNASSVSEDTQTMAITHRSEQIDEKGSSRDNIPDDGIHEILGGDAFELRSPKRLSTTPANPDDFLSNKRAIQDVSSCTFPSTSNDLILNGNQQPVTTNADQEEPKRELAWVLGLHRVESEENITYLWQPRFMLSTMLRDKDCPVLRYGDEVNTPITITSMSANKSESMLVVGNSSGEVLLYDLRCHPPELVHKNRFDNKGGTQAIKQVEFFDHDNIIVCNGGIHLYNTKRQTTVSCLLPSNVNYHSADQVRKQWKGDNFLGFSLFPKGTGLEEMLGDTIGEFAAISSSHIYTVDIRCRDSTVNNHCPKKLNADPIFRSLTWNTAIEGKEENNQAQEATESNKDEEATTFEFMSITTHADWICTGSKSGHIHCYDRRIGKLLHCWKGHTKSVEYMEAISKYRLLSVSGDKSSVLWDMTKTPPQKISSIYNIPGKEFSMNATSHLLSDNGIVSIPGESNLLLCTAAGRKAVFMAQKTQSDGQPSDTIASRIVMSDFRGNRIPSADKLNISSIAMLPCRQLVLLGCKGEIHVCL